MDRALKLLLLWGPESWVRKIYTQPTFLRWGWGMEGGGTKSHMEPSWDYRRDGKNQDVFLLYEGHNDLGFVGVTQLWDPFFFHTQLMTSHLK